MNMQEVTDWMLARMNYFSFWKGPGDATAWDINLGWCEEWALEAKRRFGGEVLWYDEIADKSIPKYERHLHDVPNHAVLYLEGLYYDSQTPDGAHNVKEMDVYKRVPRAEYLARQLGRVA